LCCGMRFSPQPEKPQKQPQTTTYGCHDTWSIIMKHPAPGDRGRVADPSPYLAMPSLLATALIELPPLFPLMAHASGYSATRNTSHSTHANTVISCSLWRSRDCACMPVRLQLPFGDQHATDRFKFDLNRPQFLSHT
jgi:hypothetical protein